MSLINEALKKAQRQRTEEPSAPASPVAPGTIAAPVPRIAQRRPPLPARTLIVLIGGAVSLVVMAGAFVFIFFFADSDPAPVTKPASVVAKPAVPAPASVVVAPPVPATVPVAVVPPAPVPAPAVITPSVVVVPEPVVAVQLPPITPPAPVPAEPVVVAVPVNPAPPAVRIPVANTRVYEFLETLKVSGIRVSDTDPKVIMNDRVYRLNDLVDRATQLRLIRVGTSSITFVDGSGFEYKKSF